MYWKIYAYLRELEGMNAYIDKHDSNLMSERSFRSFLKAYLDNSFNVLLERPFKIFDFIDGYSIDNCEFYEQMLIDSKYLNSMPGKQVINALFELTNGYLDQKMPNLTKFLISRVEPFRLLELSDTDVSYLYECYSGLGIEDKILELGVNYIINLSEELDYSDSKEFLAFCKEHLSLEELEKVCRMGDFAVSDVMDVILQSYDTPELDMLSNIMINKNERKQPVIDIKRKRKINVFEQFLDKIKEKEEITEQHKDYLATKLLESKDYSKMLDWLTNVECEANEKLIEELVGKATEFIILYSISPKYIPYALCKLLQQGKVNYMGIDTLDAIFLGHYDNERLECILDNLYKINPNIKFSRKTTIYLLKLGVSKFSTLINEYELTEEEREEILESLREINSDWLVIYGAYLVYGEASTKYSEEIAAKKMARIRNLKK